MILLLWEGAHWEATWPTGENMMQRMRELPVPLKILLAVAAAATVLLALATGVGVMAAALVGPGQGSSGGEPERAGGTEQRESGSQERTQPRQAGRTEQRESGSQEGTQPRQAGKGKGAPDRLTEAEYVSTVGRIQSEAVKTLLDSHDKLLRYDILTTDDVREMRANESALRGFAARVDGLDPPRRYVGQYEVFRSAINELHEAAQLAYGLVADPTVATKTDFDEYDRRVSEAAGRLRQSNETLARNYRSIGDVQEVSPL
jgi:hypothetical protein